ncbi:MAG: hypothetical protein GKR83_06610 [Synechococcus sp. s2_metabat2_7]|nr:hypothetical protein [Synechococcus sp. s2_metabat2_7]
MARRSSLPGRSASEIRALYDIAIMSGISITLLGIGVTMFLAFAEASSRPYGHWISGQVFF